MKTRAHLVLCRPLFIFVTFVLGLRVAASNSHINLEALPLHFEPAEDATPASFIARGPGYTSLLSRQGVTMALKPRVGEESGLVRLQVVGAQLAGRINPAQEMQAKVNYYLGGDSTLWRTGVPTYGRLRCPNIYPGIDLVYYGNQRQLEYDFVVSPGADPNQIELEFDAHVQLEETGDLRLQIQGGTVRQRRPIVFQNTPAGRREIEGAFKVHGRRVRFALGDYDPTLPLVIDPVLEYSSYFGSSAIDAATGIAVDASGHVVVVGYTLSLSDFPFVNAFQNHNDPRISPGGSFQENGFVMRLTPSGTLVYATYLGGRDNDEARAVALDNASNAYITGWTASAGGFGGHGRFPTTEGAYLASITSGTTTAFVTKLSAAGGLVYSTFLFNDFSGGVYHGNGIAVDGTGHAFVTGRTANFFAFVVKLNVSGSALLYTNLSRGSIGYGIAVDSDGSAHVAGDALANQPFPTSDNAFQTNNLNNQGLPRAFYMKLDPAGTNRLYATVYATRDTPNARAVSVNHLGHAQIIGSIREPLTPRRVDNFPIKNAFQSQFGGGFTDAYIIRFNPAISGTNSLVYASYLGGSGDDAGTGIKVDAIGRMFVTGTTTSTNFPVFKPLQTNNAGATDGFVAQFDIPGGALLFSTYFGGTANDSPAGIAIDLTAENLYFAGLTVSTNFPLLNAVQQNLKDTSGDAFAVRIRLQDPELTFTVNTSDDMDDGVCNTDHCSLREAITAANRTPGKQTIRFDIPGVPRIEPDSQLPTISEPVIIDATTQPNTAKVELRSSADIGSGLFITAGDSEVRGLIITYWRGSGIILSGKGGNRIQGNVIGITADGNRGENDGSGILLIGSSTNLIGGDTPEQRNFISGNRFFGVELTASSNDNDVFGNFIGSDEAGFGSISNGIGGVRISDSYGNHIGNATSTVGGAPGNLISGNGVYGILIEGESSFDNAIMGNLIGTRLLAELPLPNVAGVVIESRDNRVGGLDPMEGNVISGNLEFGVAIFDADDNRIQANYIGTDWFGNRRVPNGLGGVLLRKSKTLLGGASAQPGRAPGNVISGNQGPAVKIEGSDSRVQGNLIGLKQNGSDPLPNSGPGVLINARGEPAFQNIIGGQNPGEGNVIAGNGTQGIRIEGPSTRDPKPLLGNRIEGNFIGVTTGGISVPNTFVGIELLDVSGNIIGGDAPQAANTIAFNGDVGVRVASFTGVQNSILRNAIYGNELMGIDLGFQGVDPNDLGDGDSGINLGQNFPVLRRAVDFGDTIVVHGTLNSQPGRAYRLEFFETAICDDSGHGEGARFLGMQVVHLGSLSTETFMTMLPRPVAPGFVTATATDPEGNTSEFSACIQVFPPFDLDGDGVDDLFEDGGPNRGDGNNDGTPDRQQPNIGTDFSWTSMEYITGELLEGYQFTEFDVALSLSGVTELPMDVQLPLDYIKFRSIMPAPSGLRTAATPNRVRVTIYFPPHIPINAYYMFGPTPDNGTPRWYEFTFDGTTGAVFEGNKVTLHFVDGARGDHDLLANGVIVSAGALAIAAPSLRITQLSPLALGQWFLKASGEAAHTYSVQSSSNLTSWTTTWTTNSTTGVFDYIDRAPSSSKFYRVFQHP